MFIWFKSMVLNIFHVYVCVCIEVPIQVLKQNNA